MLPSFPEMLDIYVTTTNVALSFATFHILLACFASKCSQVVILEVRSNVDV